MTGAVRLKLTIRNIDSLDNGMPTIFDISERNAVIGRSPTVDWSLPDPRAFISSRHCEITFAGGEYRLIDRSTNGTFLNGSDERMRGPHILCDGDVIAVGQYEIVATIDDGKPRAPAASPPQSQQWDGWQAPAAPAPATSPVPGWGPATPAPPAAQAPGWAPVEPPPGAVSSGWGSPSAPPAAAPAAAGQWGASQAPSPIPPASDWGAPAAAAAIQPPPPAGTGWGAPARPASGAAPSSPWDAAPVAPDPASAWGSSAGGVAPAAEDAWGKLAGSYAVDWQRGGFGAEASLPAGPASDGAFVPPALSTPRQAASVDTAKSSPPPVASADLALARFLEAAGLDPQRIKSDDAIVRGGRLLKRLVAGLVVMMEARARAKAQMGAQTTVFSRNGNNPIKFSRSPEEALAQLLADPVGGFMPADEAIEDSFRDLQVHQMATLKAMQGALRATLARFSPDAIRQRAVAKGLIDRVMKDGALWKTYEREFSGVAQGSDEAFMDVFAKEFRKAYEEQASRR